VQSLCLLRPVDVGVFYIPPTSTFFFDRKLMDFVEEVVPWLGRRGGA